MRRRCTSRQATKSWPTSYPTESRCGPRRPRDNNRRGGNRNNRPGWARTQADGPRDGSESHHAARPAARPIYAPGRQGPVTAEWSPGE